jgi:hypothetical protein
MAKEENKKKDDFLFFIKIEKEIFGKMKWGDLPMNQSCTEVVFLAGYS